MEDIKNSLPIQIPSKLNGSVEDGKSEEIGEDDDLKNIEFEYVSMEDKDNVLTSGKVTIYLSVTITYVACCRIQTHF